jgi:RNA polymerase sigma factor for flagellar operon FliA
MSKYATAVAPSRALNHPFSKRAPASPRRERGLSSTSQSLPFAEVSAPSHTSCHRLPVEAACDAAASAALAERDRVVLEHLHLVKSIATNVRRSLPVHADFDDLVQAGMVGLIDAADKYNNEKQNSFATYAKHRIRGAILDSLRQLDWASRDMRRRQKLVAAAMNELTGMLHRNPSETEVADKTGMELGLCRQTMTDLRNGAPLSSSRFANGNDDLPVPDYPTTPDMQPDFICCREELRSVLDQVVNTLPERYKKVVVMYYQKDMSMKEIGAVLNINESRVSQIHKAALAKLAGTLEGYGTRSHQAFID